MLIGTCSLTPRVGKTTVAQYLKKEKGFLHGELNEPIIVLAEKFFGYNGDKLDPVQRKKLQDIGLMGKGLYPEIWLYHTLGLVRRKMWGIGPTISPSFLFFYHYVDIVKQIEEKGVNKFLEGNDVVLGGIRSPSEAEEIKKMGGYVILVSNNRISEEKTLHPVENELSNYKFETTIENNGSFEELYSKIDETLRKIR